jgi:hypothetical protein
MTPARCLEFAAVMESEGPELLRSMLEKNPNQFWNMFGRFADPSCRWQQVSDAELAEINQRFVRFLRERARLRFH